MIGIVGNLLVRYIINESEYTEFFDPRITEVFCLSQKPNVKFRIEEVTYVEDTVYGVTISLIEPVLREDEYLVGSGKTEFSIDIFGIHGYFELSF